MALAEPESLGTRAQRVRSIDWMRASCVLCVVLSRAPPATMAMQGEGAGALALQYCRLMSLQLFFLLLGSLWALSSRATLQHVGSLIVLAVLVVLLNVLACGVAPSSITQGVLSGPKLEALEQAWLPVLIAGTMLACAPIRHMLLYGSDGECIGGPWLQVVLLLGAFAFATDTVKGRLLGHGSSATLANAIAGTPRLGFWPLYLHFAGALVLSVAMVGAGRRRFAGLAVAMYAESAILLGSVAPASGHGHAEVLGLALPSPQVARCAALAELFWAGAFCALSPCIFREVVAESAPKHRRARWPMMVLVTYIVFVVTSLAVWPDAVTQKSRWAFASVALSGFFLALVCPGAGDDTILAVNDPLLQEGRQQDTTAWLRPWSWFVLTTHIALHKACGGRHDMDQFLGIYMYLLCVAASALPFAWYYDGGSSMIKASFGQEENTNTGTTAAASTASSQQRQTQEYGIASAP